MPTAQFIHDGNAIDYTPGADTPAGSVVVLNDLIGVTKRSIKAGELGALHVVGVYAFPKATGSDTAIAKGAQTYWDAGNQRATTESSGNIPLGKCTVAAGNDDETVSVRLSA